MDWRSNDVGAGPSWVPPLSRRQALGLLGLGVAAATLALSGCGCSVDTSSPQIDVEPIPVWESPYDWNAVMENTKGRLYYYPDQRLSSRFGIDVSDHDGQIDWERVAADGVEFAFIRVGYRGYTQGGLMDDEFFEANLAGATANAIPHGVYMFSSAISELEAKEEADYVIAKLAGRGLEYPVVFDQEKVEDSSGRANNLTRAQYTANAKAFCDRVAAAGYQAMVYGNKHQLALLDLDELSAWPVWYAEYGVSVPTGQYDFTFWQYSHTGRVEGIEGDVDMNIQFLVDGE